MMAPSPDTALEMRNLHVHFAIDSWTVRAVDGVNLHVARGEVLALVGEAGAGKSSLAMSVLGMLDPPGIIAGGEIRLGGRNLVGLPEAHLRGIRGKQVALMPGDPHLALNPMLRVGAQLIEAIQAHESASLREARSRARVALAEVGLPDAATLLRAYPHQLSRVQRVLVVLAMALLHRPDVVIADDPLALLEPREAAALLHLIRALVLACGTALLWITRDPAPLAGFADRVVTLHNGRIITPPPPALRLPTAAAQAGAPIEHGEVAVLALQAARHASAALEPLLEIDLALWPGEMLGVIGEVGSGLATLGRLIVGLVPPSSGRVVWNGQDRAALPTSLRKSAQLAVQLLFANPQFSLNPRQNVADIVGEAPSVHRLTGALALPAYVDNQLRRVGLDPAIRRLTPPELNPLDRHRLAIARALAVQPEVLVFEDIFSGLEPTEQAQLLVLIDDLRRELNLACVFFSQDSALIARIASRVAVLYRGRVVETAAAAVLVAEPAHPYTIALLAGRAGVTPLAGAPLSRRPPAGCAFHAQCSHVEFRCRIELPLLRPVGATEGNTHLAACHLDFVKRRNTV